MARIESGRVYYITNTDNGIALDHRLDTNAVDGYSFHGRLNQQWFIESAGQGLHTLKCVMNGKYLGYGQPLQPDAITIGVETAMKWAIVQEEEDTYRIFVPKIWLQLSLNRSASGTAVQLSYPLPDKNQTWKIIRPA